MYFDHLPPAFSHFRRVWAPLMNSYRSRCVPKERRKRAIADDQNLVEPDHTKYTGRQGEEGYPVLKVQQDAN
jgi:hypothetical protein